MADIFCLDFGGDRETIDYVKLQLGAPALTITDEVEERIRYWIACAKEAREKFGKDINVASSTYYMIAKEIDFEGNLVVLAKVKNG